MYLGAPSCPWCDVNRKMGALSSGRTTTKTAATTVVTRTTGSAAGTRTTAAATTTTAATAPVRTYPVTNYGYSAGSVFTFIFTGIPMVLNTYILGSIAYGLFGSGGWGIFSAIVVGFCSFFAVYGSSDNFRDNPGLVSFVSYSFVGAGAAISAGVGGGIFMIVLSVLRWLFF